MLGAVEVGDDPVGELGGAPQRGGGIDGVERSEERGQLAQLGGLAGDEVEADVGRLADDWRFGGPDRFEHPVGVGGGGLAGALPADEAGCRVGRIADDGPLSLEGRVGVEAQLDRS